MNKQVNLLLLLFITLFSYGQEVDEYTLLFKKEEPIKIKLKYSNKILNKKNLMILLLLFLRCHMSKMENGRI